MPVLPAQANDTIPERGRADHQRPDRYVKINATTLLGFPGIAVERSVGRRGSFNFDVSGALWRSLGGVPMQYVMVVPEWRYHQRDGGLGWYGGLHVGGATYRLQKWNYWGTSKYQQGYSLLLGATIGHKRLIRDRFLLDAFVGGGDQQGYYRGYDAITGERYDGADGLNESCEWLPYRAGVMIGIAFC